MAAQGAGYALTVLFAINLMNFFDRQILGAVGEQIRREWGLGDTALGALGTAFTLLYAFVGVPFGRLADRGVRKYILAGGVFLWSVLTAASGLARNFWELFAVRLGVGVGEASCAPAAISLIGDLYRTEHRARATATFMLGLPIGLGLSFLVGGYVGQRWGWRTALFIAAAPGLLCAVAALFIREPPRGMTEEHQVGQKRRPGSPYKLVLSIPTLWWIILSGALHNFNMYALGAFLASFLIRYHHVSLSQAGLISMLVYGLSGIVGLIGGGIAADALYKRRTDGRLLVATIAIVICAPLMYLSLTRPQGDVMGFALLMGSGVGVMYAYYATVYSTIQDVVEPALRGTAMSLYFGAMYLAGASLGPLGTGLVSDHFTAEAAARAGVVDQSLAALEPFRGEGLHSAMYVIPALAVLLAIVLFAASRTVTRDVTALRAWTSQQGGR
ncbi:MAG TPA: MFS transporter [Vicinamibacterales bacterium]|nr:MFS transporter [Vicinamibacterales bacterium]